MAFAPGTRLGPYDILSVLGAGGMGEVYRARDAKLNRDVAIKVLLPAVAGDAQRLARFSREAQLLASLNHPNIAHIHGLEESGGIQALVMELVEGETLAARLAGGPLLLREATSMPRRALASLLMVIGGPPEIGILRSVRRREATICARTMSRRTASGS